MRWELYCRVIDNHGDLGVCWRLATDLASRGDAVRLWVDDASALAWMAPEGAEGVEVRVWRDAAPPDLGDVVVEAFGCELPPAVVAAMAARRPRPVWINLEYLSAEGYVERSHGLPSPTHAGIGKWFFYPGFSARTGGLLRRPSLVQEQARFDGRAWLAAHGWGPHTAERIVSLFCYPQLALAEWLPLLAAEPTLLLATPGAATGALRGLGLPPGLRVIELPWLSQTDYDHLLWSSDLNAVRGEDSFAQAHWADAPLLWHIYPQDDGAHGPKLEAWLDRALAGADPALGAAVRAVQRAWNGLGPLPAELPPLAAWRAQHRGWREQLLALPDLATALREFVAQRPEKP